MILFLPLLSCGSSTSDMSTFHLQGPLFWPCVKIGRIPDISKKFLPEVCGHRLNNSNLYYLDIVLASVP
jgi:hypothetical protein